MQCIFANKELQMWWISLFLLAHVHNFEFVATE